MPDTLWVPELYDVDIFNYDIAIDLLKIDGIVDSVYSLPDGFIGCVFLCLEVRESSQNRTIRCC